MKTLITACIIGLIASGVSAAEPPRDAAAILKDYDQVKLPTADSSKTKDQQYVREYFQQRTAAVEKQNALAEELYRSHPEHPRATPLMATRLMNLMRGKDSAKVIPEIEQFVKDHPRDEQSSNLLLLLAQRTSRKEQRLSIYRRIVADYADSRAAKTAAGSIRQIEGIGKPFDLAFTDAITGKLISIKNLRGKVVVIDFWATWCGPCVAEMPKMKGLYSQYKDSGVEFIGVSLDSPGEGLSKLKKFVEDKEIDWPQYYQGNSWQSEFSQSWGISGIPTVFVIDAEGKLYSTDARGKLDKLIPELLERRDGSGHRVNKSRSASAAE